MLALRLLPRPVPDMSQRHKLGSNLLMWSERISPPPELPRPPREVGAGPEW